jgi:hypothetical protein
MWRNPLQVVGIEQLWVEVSLGTFIPCLDELVSGHGEQPTSLTCMYACPYVTHVSFCGSKKLVLHKLSLLPT